MSIAVKLNPMTLRFASEYMRSDRELVLQAVRLNGVCLKYADDRLLRDPGLIKTAFRTYPGIIQDVKDGVNLGWDFDLELVKSGAKLPCLTGRTIQRIFQLIDNKRIYGTIRDSIQDTSKVFSQLPLLYADHDIMKKAVRFYPLTFCKAEEEIRANEEILITALKSIEDTSRVESRRQ